MESEDLIQCPKGCGQSFPVSKMHNHLNECKGQPSYIWNPQQSNISIPISSNKSVSPYQQAQQMNTLIQKPVSQDITTNQPAIEQPKEHIIKKETIKPSWCKKCGSEVIESDSFKACPKCKWIKVKPKYIGFFVLRYSMLIFWLGAGVGFILFAWGYHTYGAGIIP